MSLFDKKKPVKEVEPLTAKRAQELYAMFAEGIGETTMFIEHEVPFAESKVVWTEIKRLEAEVMSKMSGTFIIKAGTPAVYDEKGKLVKEAIPPVYFVVKSEKMLVASLKSDLLDVAILTQHVREYSDGNPDAAPDFKTWLESFKKEM